MTVITKKRAAIRGRVKKRSLLQEIWHKKHWYLFLLPTFVSLLIFQYYPPLSALYHAFFRWDGVTKHFVGLAHFRYMFTEDWRFLASIPNVFILMVVKTIFVSRLFMPILVAELIYNIKRPRWAYTYRLLLVIPMVVPMMVILYLWEFIFEPNFGLANSLLGATGLEKLQSGWFSNPKMALNTFLLVNFPWIAGGGTGLAPLIYLAGLLGIPDAIVDAARIDGATGLRRIWHVDLPLIMGQIKAMVILGIIGRLQGYAPQLIITDGGPGVATLVPGLHMYKQAFMYAKMGYGSAIGLVLFLLILLLTFVSMKYLRSSVEY